MCNLDPFKDAQGEGITALREYHHRHSDRSPIDAKVGISHLQRISWAAA
jgi:hypothetical protein